MSFQMFVFLAVVRIDTVQSTLAPLVKFFFEIYNSYIFLVFLGIVCIDTVYSALGTVAPLAEFVDICNSHGCIMVADEAHTLGVIGKS